MRELPGLVPFVEILGSRVQLVTVAQTVDQIEHWIEKREERCRQIVVTGFHGLMEAHKNANVHSVLNAADLWIPDGIAPVWIAWARGYKTACRASGTEVMKEFLRRADKFRYSSFFYGDTSATLQALKSEVAMLYPNHQTVGTCSPPFREMTPEEELSIIEQINQARPDVVWVALGMPKQDLWISKHLHRLQVPAAIGVGAAFGFLSNTVDRCPAWMGDAGFEWVYRLFKEPKKLWRRDLLDGPRFLFHACRELLRKEVPVADRPNA